LEVLHTARQALAESRGRKPVLKEEVKPSNDTFCGEGEETAAAESGREVAPADANIAVDPEE
jgi:hypothetical protein